MSRELTGKRFPGDFPESDGAIDTPGDDESFVPAERQGGSVVVMSAEVRGGARLQIDQVTAISPMGIRRRQETLTSGYGPPGFYRFAFPFSPLATGSAFVYRLVVD